MKFTGKDEEINLLGDGTEKPEFGEWSWVSPDQLIELVGSTDFYAIPVYWSPLANIYMIPSLVQAVVFKKPVYKEVLNVFAPHLQ